MWFNNLLNKFNESGGKLPVGFSNYNIKALTSDFRTSDFDSFDSRLIRYHFLEQYYNNTVYNKLVYAYSELYKSDRNLYRFVRGIYNPIGRLVDFYPNKTYGGLLDFTDLSKGAIGLVNTDSDMDNAIRQLWIDSNWQRKKSVFVKYGAMLGDSFIKIVEDKDKGKVFLQVLHPSIIKSIKKNFLDEITEVVIEYQKTDKEQTYTYTEVITQEKFSTFKNRQPFSFFENYYGEPLDSWENTYGFVPLVHVKHIDNGNKFGVFAGSTYTLPKIDELNDLAAMLHDQVYKSVNPLLFFEGVDNDPDTDEANSVVNIQGSKHQIPALFAGRGAKASSLVTHIDYHGALNVLKNLTEEIEQDIPELSLHTLRGTPYASDPSIRAAYTDASDRIEEARNNYNIGLVEAHKMALAIGGFNAYPNYENYSLENYKDGSLEHTIASKDVIEDTLAENAVMQVLLALKDNPYAVPILQRMGYSEDQIEEIKTEVENHDIDKLVNKKLFENPADESTNNNRPEQTNNIEV